MNGMRTILGWRDGKRSESPSVDSYGNRLLAFTLIELLVVIAIIGTLAAIGLAAMGGASLRSKAARISGEHAKIVTSIESYKAETGNYPPDNGDRTAWPDAGDRTNYLARAGRNPLYYELTGALYTNGNFIALRTETLVAGADLKAELGVDGIENSSRQKLDVPYRNGPTFKGEVVKTLQTKSGNDVDILAVPVTGTYELPGKTGKINPWFYDSSSKDRHNPESYDLWTEYLGGSRKIPDGSGGFKNVPATNVFGNWKEY